MPSSWKCAECGLVNFATDVNCKRCGAAHDQAGVPAEPPPAGIVLEDGYVLPPPPSSSGVWRDGGTLVMSKDASLPDRCVKCNAPAHGYRLKRNFSWHHPAIFLVILVAWVIYLVLALTLSKRATVYLGLCPEHIQRRKNLVIAGWAGMALSLVGAFAALANEYIGIGMIGLLLFLASIFWLVFVSRVVKVKKIDDRYVWLNGIDEGYLSQFPTTQGI